MKFRSLLTRRTSVLMCVIVAFSSTLMPNASADRSGVDERSQKIVGTIVDASPVWKIQEKIDSVVKDIRTGVSADASGGISGVIVDPDKATLSLYWKGALPGVVTDRIAAARADGIEVVVRQAPYTEAELLAEADRISQKPLFSGQRVGQRMMKVSLRPDGTGLDVGLHGLPSNVQPQQAREVVPALDSTVPLSVRATDLVSFTTRLYDTAPFWGGSFLYRSTPGNSCTSAFGVTGLNGASTYLLTAAHCGEGQWGSWYYLDENGGVRQTIYGNTIPAGRSTQVDVQLIQTPAGAASHVYWGTNIDPPNEGYGAFNGVPVRGWTPNSTGNAFCLSGSFSGTVCEGDKIRVTGTGITVTYDPPYNGVGRVTNLVQGYDVTGTRSSAIVGQGDSGGPVVSPTSNGGVLARGVISGQSDERPCVGYAPPDRSCGRVVYFADLQNAMTTVGVRLNTA